MSARFSETDLLRMKEMLRAGVDPVADAASRSGTQLKPASDSRADLEVAPAAKSPPSDDLLDLGADTPSSSKAPVARPAPAPAPAAAAPTWPSAPRVDPTPVAPVDSQPMGDSAVTSSDGISSASSSRIEEPSMSSRVELPDLSSARLQLPDVPDDALIPSVKDDLEAFVVAQNHLYKHIIRYQAEIRALANEISRAVCLGGRVWVLGERMLQGWAPILVDTILGRGRKPIPARVLPAETAGLPDEALPGDVLLAYMLDGRSVNFVTKLAEGLQQDLVVGLIRPFDKRRPALNGLIDVPAPARTARRAVLWGELLLGRLIDRSVRALVEERTRRLDEPILGDSSTSGASSASDAAAVVGASAPEPISTF